MKNRNLVPGRWGVGEMLLYWIVNRQFSPFFEKEDGRRRKLLRDRPEPEFRGRRIRNFIPDLPNNNKAPRTIQRRAGALLSINC